MMRAPLCFVPASIGAHLSAQHVHMLCLDCPLAGAACFLPCAVQS